MLFIGIILTGMLAGGAAQLTLGIKRTRIDWSMAFVSGIIGSFIGGIIGSTLAGEGLELRPTGLIGSFVGALIVTGIWQWWNRRGASEG